MYSSRKWTRLFAAPAARCGVDSSISRKPNRHPPRDGLGFRRAEVLAEL
jgi:hypothetical protein